MKDPAYDIATMLVQKKMGVLGEDLFATGDVPPKPDFLTFLNVTGSAAPDDARYAFSYAIVQIVVRGNIGGYVQCMEKMYSIHNYVHGITNRTVNDTRYAFIYNVSGPINLEMDETMRPLMAATYRTFRQIPPYNFMSGSADDVSSTIGTLGS